jgi:hypothetical protein
MLYIYKHPLLVSKTKITVVLALLSDITHVVTPRDHAMRGSGMDPTWLYNLDEHVFTFFQCINRFMLHRWI